MGKITKILPKDTDDWLKIRQQSIGGSDAATIVGLNDYSSPYALWSEKTGDLVVKEENEAMRQGHDLEDYVARRFVDQTGKAVEIEPNVIRNSDYPWAHATIDRKIINENAGLECKTVSSYNWNKYRDDGFPFYYYIQCLHYMAVCNFDKYYLAVLVLGNDFQVFEFERDEETEQAIKNLMDSEKAFWKLVKEKTPPEMDGSKATDEALLNRYSYPEEGSEINLIGLDDKAERLAKLKAKKKETDKEIKLIEQEIKAQLGSAEVGTTYDYQFSWKPQERRSFQLEKFKKDYPDLEYDDYYKTTRNRVFRVKEVKH